MTELLANHSISVSQCGYNTVMDILRSGISSLVVPFAQGQEVEQSNRAERLSGLGLMRKAEASEFDVDRFLNEVEQLLSFKPNSAALDLDGTAKSADIIYRLVTSKTESVATKHHSAIGVVCA